MNTVDPDHEAAIDAIARRHGFSVDATTAMFEAVLLGNGSMAQFSHPEFGGSGQWMRGGMTMVGDMFNHRLKSAVDALCTDLASLAASRSQPASHGSQRSPVSAGSGSAFGSSSGRWWPGDLGMPNASGAQNSTRYAYFANSRRLAIESGGRVTVYDTGEHQIGGVSQQQSSGSDLRFSSQLGPVDISRLPVVHGAENHSPSADPIPAESSVPLHSLAGDARGHDSKGGHRQDVPSLIEKLADLHAKGILTPEEFNAKKAELLRRI